MLCSPGDDNNNNPDDDDGLTGEGVQRTLLISDCDIVKEEEIRILSFSQRETMRHTL